MENGLEIIAPSTSIYPDVRSYLAICPFKHSAWLVQTAMQEHELTVRCVHCGASCNISSYGVRPYGVVN